MNRAPTNKYQNDIRTVFETLVVAATLLRTVRNCNQSWIFW